MNQKREYRILEKKVALCRFAEGREREREGGREEGIYEEQVSRHEVKHRNGTKKENWVQCVMQRARYTRARRFRLFRSSLLFVPYFLLIV